MGATSRNLNSLGVQMPENVFDTEKESGIFGKVLRPLNDVPPIVGRVIDLFDANFLKGGEG